MDLEVGLGTKLEHLVYYSLLSSFCDHYQHELFVNSSSFLFVKIHSQLVVPALL
jgi:hypothetical protein